MTGTETEWARVRVAQLLSADDREERLIAVAVSSLDGSAAVRGKSGGLSSPADKALLYAWREVADVLLVGSRTLTIERYGSLLPAVMQDAREARGLPRVPPAATISRDGSLDVAEILRADEPPALRVYSEAAPPPDELLGPRAELVGWRYVPKATVGAVVEDLRQRGSRVIVCEGGPAIFAQALAAGVVTDFSLTYAPTFVGQGTPLLPPYDADERPFRLAGHAAVENHVFLHYAL